MLLPLPSLIATGLLAVLTHRFGRGLSQARELPTGPMQAALRRRSVAGIGTAITCIVAVAGEAVHNASMMTTALLATVIGTTITVYYVRRYLQLICAALPSQATLG